jgi:hypothetical protein
MQSVDKNIEFITNPREIKSFEEFRSGYIEKKRKENQPKIEDLQAEIKELRIKLRMKIEDFKSRNGKPNLANQALMQDIYNYSNRIIEKVCNINELENIVTPDSEKESLIM